MGPLKRAGEAEYRLRISHNLSERTHLPSILLALRTTKSFANFRYELAVEDRVEGKTIHLKILGLKAPLLDLPAAGPADFRREYEGLKGNCHVVIEGLDGSRTTVAIRISKQKVTLTTPVAGGIIDIDIPTAPHSSPTNA